MSLQNALKYHFSDSLLDGIVAFPSDKAIWKIVSDAGNEVEKCYWERLFLIPSDWMIGKEELVCSFLENGHPGKAIDGLGWLLYDKQQPSPTLVMDALERFVQFPNDQGTLQNRPYTIECLFEYLETVTELSDSEQECLALLEWQFFPLLEHRTKPFSLSLFYRLATDPSFFVEMLMLMYPIQNNEGEEKVTEAQKVLAQQAFQVIRAWDFLPSQQNQMIEPTTLIAWYEKGLELAKKVDREDCFNIRFGKKLGQCNIFGSDGHWPHEAIRLLLEKPVENLRRMFQTGKLNAITNQVRHIGEETKRKDEELANQMRISSRIIAPQYPGTASLLAKLADGIEELWTHPLFRAI